MPRWKAWLCRLASPGIANWWRSSPPCGATPTVTPAMVPPLTMTCTSSRHPEGKSADAKCSRVMFPAGWTERRHDYMSRHISQASRLGEDCMAERFDRIWHNVRLVTMRQDMPDLGVVEDGLIAARDGRIVFAGTRADFPPAADAAERIDCAGRWMTPGLVDCHTHLVYGGNRAHEFELRLKGASYEEIARAGGGIVSTVAATRKASEAELVASALSRLDALIGEGVTTVEIKSGYGLDTQTEMRQLAAARRLGGQRKVAIRT